MNILFFLTPKSDVAFIYSDANLREAIDLMEAHRYSALPILTKQGRYAGTLTEGDLLWYMKSHMNQSLKDMELISVMEVKRRQDNSPVNAGAISAMICSPSDNALASWKIWDLSEIAPNGQFTIHIPQDTHLSGLTYARPTLSFSIALTPQAFAQGRSFLEIASYGQTLLHFPHLIHFS